MAKANDVKIDVAGESTRKNPPRVAAPYTDSTEKEDPAEEKAEEGDAVKVPEEFQKAVYELIEEANSHELEFLRHCISERQTALYKEENPSPEMSVEGMPQE